MDTIRIKDKVFEPFISQEEITSVIAKMAEQIKADVEGKNPLFVCILNGAFMFATELVYAMNVPYEITFARYASYQGTSSTGNLREILPIQEDIRGRTVVLLEDIVDSGFTMQNVIKRLYELEAGEVRLATLLLKPDALRCELKPDYVGFRIPNDFIVGHGLDYDQEGRCYRDIYKIRE